MPEPDDPGSRGQPSDRALRPPRGRRSLTAVVVAVAVALTAVLLLMVRWTGAWAGDSDGLPGVVVAVSDVSTIPDRRDVGGWVAALPPEAVDEVLALGPAGETVDGLRYAHLTLDVEAVEELGGVVAEVDGSGRFRLAAVGEQLVCRLSAGGTGRSAPAGASSSSSRARAPSV